VAPDVFAEALRQFLGHGQLVTSDLQFDEADFVEGNLVTDATIKGHVEYHHSQQAVGEFGFEQKNLHINFRQAFPGGLIDVDEKPKQYVFYGKGSFRPSPLWDLEAELRYNLFAVDKTFHNLDPASRSNTGSRM
jgi:hypothetical protein